MPGETVAMARAEADSDATGAEAPRLSGRAATVLRKTGTPGGAPRVPAGTGSRVAASHLISAAGKPKRNGAHRARERAEVETVP